MLGHELRNPLAAITNAARRPRPRSSTGADVRRVTGIIDRQTAHLARLVDDLLDVARVTSGKIELRTQPLDLRELVARRDRGAPAGRAHGARHTGRDRAASPSRARRSGADRAGHQEPASTTRLKYTPAGGRVRVITGRDGGHAVLRVRDTGDGIRPELLERVFDLFVQEPQAARPLARRPRPRVDAREATRRATRRLACPRRARGAGRGSEFVVRLPAAGEPRGEPGAVPDRGAGRAAAARPDRRGQRGRARTACGSCSSCAGHEVEAADDGRAALEKVAAFRPEVALDRHRAARHRRLRARAPPPRATPARGRPR